MYPTLISIGPLSISSFGFFLMLGFLASAFVCFRLAKTYDLSEEKVLDLVILTFLGGLIGARIYFVATHWDLFPDLGRIILLNRYPGLSFWGGLVGGVVALKIFTKRTKLNFWQIADFGAVGLILGLVLGNLGCFLGGCGYGAPSNLPIATSVVGLVGKRFPISLIESLILLFVFLYFWRQTVRFHFSGRIISLTLLVLGIVKFVTEFFRGDSQPLPFLPGLYFGQAFATILLAVGLTLFYRRSKRSITADLVSLKEVFTSSKRRELILSKTQKSWYNHKVRVGLSLSKTTTGLWSLPKKLRRRLNVKPTPTKLTQD